MKSLLGIPWDETEVRVAYGRTFFYDKVGWEDLILGYCTKKDFDHYLNTSDYTFMKDEDDPLPGELLYAELNCKYRKQRIKRAFRLIPKLMDSLFRHLRWPIPAILISTFERDCIGFGRLLSF